MPTQAIIQTKLKIKKDEKGEGEYGNDEKGEGENGNDEKGEGENGNDGNRVANTGATKKRCEYENEDAKTGTSKVGG